MKKTIALTTMTMTALALVKAATAENRIQYSMEDAAKAANKKANTFTWTFSAKTSRANDTVDASTPLSLSGKASNGETSGGSSQSEPVGNWNADGTHKITGTYYDEDGFDKDGWDSTGWHRDTGSIYGPDGYSKSGWNSEGINKETGTEYDKNGYNVDGYNSAGYNKDGYDRNGYDADGFDKNGWDKGRRITYSCYNGYATCSRTQYLNKDTGTEYDANGWNKSGKHEETGTYYDPDGYNKSGWSSEGINKETGTAYDQNGWDWNNKNEETGTYYDADGYNKSGYNSAGFDRDGYNRNGWNSEGINKETGTIYDANGFKQDGYDSSGYYLGLSDELWNDDGINKTTGTMYDTYGYTESGENIDGDDCNYGYDGYGSCYVPCFTADTPITLADGSTKRADEITYDDELLVWNFDEGKLDHAKPIWIQVPKVSPNHNYMKFSDGSVLKTINQHRIFNIEAGKFTYPMTDETPVGTHTLNAKGEVVELVEKKVIEEEVTYYNLWTERHINCFAGNVLTSCRLNNIYPIKDLKFVKDDRKLVPFSAFDKLDRKWYDGLRLAEQPEAINRGNDVSFNDKSVQDYVLRSIRSMKA